MTVGVRKPSLRFVLRTGVTLGIAGMFLFGSRNSLQTAVAEGDTRTLSFHHLHTGEDITITFKRDGRYDEAALKKLDWFMRDWRKEKSVSMDPHLFDVLWEAYREVDASAPIQVVCGYRSPETNSMLRARSKGVAETSQHTSGHAMDFFIPGVALEKLRVVGLRLQRGGVGFYPSSGSPFVHLDTGTIRHWPRMTHDQLAKVFPDGRTVHVPSDGVPLQNYALALADVERRGNEPSATSLAAARNNGIVTASTAKPQRNILTALFGGKSNDADEVGEEAAPSAASQRTPVAVASLTPPKPVAVEKIVPLPAARPAQIQVAVAMPRAKPAAAQMALASLPSATVFDNRGYWRGSVDSIDQPASEVPQAFAARAKASPLDVASADPTIVGSMPQAALAYAPEAPSAPPVRARAMGAKIQAAAVPASTALADKPMLVPAFAATLSSGAQNFDSPWMRAAMLTPSVSGYMTATRLGDTDMTSLRELMVKPSQAVAMTFSADPDRGMTAASFTGNAVVFLATATFTTQKTASLR